MADISDARARLRALREEAKSDEAPPVGATSKLKGTKKPPVKKVDKEVPERTTLKSTVGESRRVSNPGKTPTSLGGKAVSSDIDAATAALAAALRADAEAKRVADEAAKEASRRKQEDAELVARHYADAAGLTVVKSSAAIAAPVVTAAIPDIGTTVAAAATVPVPPVTVPSIPVDVTSALPVVLASDEVRLIPFTPGDAVPTGDKSIAGAEPSFEVLVNASHVFVVTSDGRVVQAPKQMWEDRRYSEVLALVTPKSNQGSKTLTSRTWRVLTKQVGGRRTS